MSLTNDSTKPSITPKPNGPYLVKDLTSFRNMDGPIDPKPTMALCRCGRSTNKPYCDGTHAAIEFNSDRLEDRVADKRVDYVGDAITVHDNRGLCAHAGRCTDGLPSVFKLKQEPWIDPNGASADEIIATVRQCPAGAVRYSVDGVEERDQDGAPGILFVPNGPYVVTGGIDLVGVERGEGASTEHFTLCRCGGSKNKPFCDGAHWHIKFDDQS